MGLYIIENCEKVLIIVRLDLIIFLFFDLKFKL